MKHRLRLISAVSLLLLSLPLTALAAKTHVVRTSETLSAIARKYRVTAEEIKTLNHLSSNRLVKGSTIIIPTRERAAAKPSENCTPYTVGKGDTLPGIARKSGIKMTELRRLNKIKGNRIKVGQTLALAEPTVCSTTKIASKSVDQRLKTVNSEILNEQEFTDTLAELTDIGTDAPVDLAKNLEDRNTFDNLKQTAYSFLGARYRFGGNSRNALDCSSFTQQVFRDQKIGLPRTAREQFLTGNAVSGGDLLRKGDLVFFSTYASFPSHVGIYLGNRKMIHASSSGRRVVISSMDTPYYMSRYLGARRFEQINPDTFDVQSLILGVEEEREGETQKNDHLGLGLMEALVK